MYDSRQWCSSGQCYHHRFILNYDQASVLHLVLSDVIPQLTSLKLCKL